MPYKKSFNLDRTNLILRNIEEVVSMNSLKDLLKNKKKPIVYCGYEPNGPIHLGHFVTITKLMDLEKAGFETIILLADIHALLNRKGTEEEIKKEVYNWKRTLSAIGIKAKIILGSEFQFSKEYQLDVMKLSQNSTIQRGLKSMQEIARDIQNATISQLLYPLMQLADIKHLGVDCALGGMEQRKVHMMGKDMEKILNYRFIALHTPLITSLKGPGQKMSKSLPGSGISITDSYDEIKKIISAAYCPEKEIKENPILQIIRLILFPRFDKIKIDRLEKFGGVVEFEKYSDLEREYSLGKIHPLDLKKSTIEYLENIIAPIRKNFF